MQQKPATLEHRFQLLMLAKDLADQYQKVGIATCIALLLTACTSPPKVGNDGADFPACGSFPNCVNSESGENSQAIDPIRANAAQWQQLVQWIKQQENWEIVGESPNFVQAVAKTAIFGFKDDVLLRFEAASDLIQVRSSSRLGYSDMGANRARVELLRSLAEDDFRQVP